MASDYVIAPPQTPSVAVTGEAARFPVRRIFCVGRNYAAHVREMGKDPDREPPFFFAQAVDAAGDLFAGDIDRLGEIAIHIGPAA